MMSTEEKNRLIDRKEYLRRNRCTDSYDLSRYMENFCTAKAYVEETLQAQMTVIERQFRDQPCWLSLMFWEGMSSGRPAEEVRSGEEALVAGVDALQISLTIFRLLALARRLSKDKWFRDGNRIFPKVCGEEEETVLQGCATGICDYIVVTACQKMQKIGSADVRRYILKQYSASINQIYQEQNVLRKGSLDENRLQQLKKIWQGTQSISMYYLGAVCAKQSVDCGRYSILKEFEFWKSLQWLHSRTEKPDANLRYSDYCIDERLATLIGSEGLTEDLKQLLEFCSNNC